MTILGQDQKYSDFDTTPFDQAREDIRDLVSIPLQAWMLVPPARRDHQRAQESEVAA